MVIDPDKFFPLTVAKMKKFMEVLLQANDLDRVEYINRVQDYLQDRIRWLIHKRNFYNSLYITDKGRDEIEEYYINLQTVAVRKTVDRINKTKEKLKRNLEILEKRDG